MAHPLTTASKLGEYQTSTSITKQLYVHHQFLHLPASLVKLMGRSFVVTSENSRFYYINIYTELGQIIILHRKIDGNLACSKKCHSLRTSVTGVFSAYSSKCADLVWVLYRNFGRPTVVAYYRHMKTSEQLLNKLY